MSEIAEMSTITHLLNLINRARRRGKYRLAGKFAVRALDLLNKGETRRTRIDAEEELEDKED